MSRSRFGLAVLSALLPLSVAQAQELRSDDPAAEPPPPARIEAGDEPTATPTMWSEWSAFKEQLREERGFEVGLNIDIVGRGTLAGPEDVWKAIARYDLLLRQHFGEDALVSMDVRGGWGEGLDERLGLFSNTDQYARTGEELFVLHLYYQQQFLEDQLTFRIGKFDIGDWIDTNRYGYYNFLAYTINHNATIALPGNTLGAMASYEPTDAGWYISGGASNSTQTPFETGLSSTFEGDSDWLSIAELGLKPEIAGREGVYRFIVWHNDRPFTTTSGSTDSDAVGFALSFDQDLTDRLGAYARYGVVDGDPLEPKHYYAAGLYLEQPLPGRPDDTLAFGFVVNEFTDSRSDVVANATDYETYFEAYYNIQVTEWAQLQPVFQVVDNPGGQDRQTAVIAGAHLALRF